MMNHYESQVKTVKDAVARYPDTFGLRNFPGDTFKIEAGASYYSDMYGVMLYTYRQTEPGRWAAFAKGTPEELLGQVVPAPRGGI